MMQREAVESFRRQPTFIFPVSHFLTSTGIQHTVYRVTYYTMRALRLLLSVLFFFFNFLFRKEAIVQRFIDSRGIEDGEKEEEEHEHEGDRSLAVYLCLSFARRVLRVQHCLCYV